jgi:hypothetical protein
MADEYHRHDHHDEAIVGLVLIGICVLPLLLVALAVAAFWRGRGEARDQAILDQAVATTRRWDAYQAQHREAVVAFLLKAERRRT